MKNLRTVLVAAGVSIAIAVLPVRATVDQVVNTVAVGGITGLGTGVATALGIAVGSVGGPVTFNGAGGTPSSMTATNLSGTAASLTAGTFSAGSASNLNSGTLPNARLGLPYFSANLSASQTVTTTVAAKVQFNTEVLDSDGWYDNATNYRFTPQLAGKYRITVSLICVSTVSSTCVSYIYKNGAAFAEGLGASTGAVAGSTTTAIVSFNGSTDYVEGWINLTCTGTCQALGGTAPVFSWIDGEFISP